MINMNPADVFIFSFSEKSESIELGYKAFMHQIFGDNILFTDGKCFCTGF